MNNPSSTAIQPGAQFRPGEVLRAAVASLRQLQQHPALAWITPQLPVRLIEAGGGEALWLGDRRLEASEAALRAARFVAIEVPADLALARSRDLPLLSGSDLRDAMALEVRDSSPFDPADLVWGYRSAPAQAGLVNVTTVIASRRMVAEHIERTAPEVASLPSLEAWVVADGAPVVLRGFGEAARIGSAARGRWLAYALMLFAVLLASAIAVTPTIQLHLRATQAATAYQALQQRAGPAVAQREELVRGRENLANLREVMSEHVDPMVALDMLTKLIPDDTWLQRVQAQGNRFTLSGQTPNAAALMNMLSSHPGLREVRAPSPATRGIGSNREAFVVEFSVDRNLLQREPVGGTAQTSDLVSSTAPVAAPVTAASAPMLTASAPMPTASAPNPAASTAAASAASSARPQR